MRDKFLLTAALEFFEYGGYFLASENYWYGHSASQFDG